MGVNIGFSAYAISINSALTITTRTETIVNKLEK